MTTPRHRETTHRRPSRFTPLHEAWLAHKVVISVLTTVVVVVLGYAMVNFVAPIVNDRLISPWWDDHEDKNENSPVAVSTSKNGEEDPTKSKVAWATPDRIVFPTGGPSDGAPPTNVRVTAINIPEGGSDDYPFWASAEISFNLAGRLNERLRIRSIEAVVDNRLEGPSGTVFFKIPQGDQPKGELAFNLDSNDLNAKSISGESNEVLDSNYVDDRTITIDKDESVGFKAKVRAHSCDCRYHIKVTFDNGRTANVTDNGTPFRIVTFRQTYKNAFTLGYNTSTGETQAYACEFYQGCSLDFQRMHD